MPLFKLLKIKTLSFHYSLCKFIAHSSIAHSAAL